VLGPTRAACEPARMIYAPSGCTGRSPQCSYMHGITPYAPYVRLAEGVSHVSVWRMPLALRSVKSPPGKESLHRCDQARGAE